MKIHIIKDYNNNMLCEYNNSLIFNLQNNGVETIVLNCDFDNKAINDEVLSSYKELRDYINNLTDEIIICTIKKLFQIICKTNSFDIYQKNKSYFLNTEPYINRFLQKSVSILNKNINLIEYYYGNKLIIDRHTEHKYKNNISFIPLLYNDNDYINQLKNIQKKIDFGFIFKYSKANRRHKIVDEITKINKNTKVIYSWGNKRDDMISQCKIIINLRSHDLFGDNRESLRIDRLVAKKIIVISEDIEIKHQYADKFIIYVKYDEIVNKANEVINNYDKYYHDIYDNFDIEKLKEESSSLIKEFIRHV